MREQEAKLKAHELIMKYGIEGATDLAMWTCQKTYNGDEEEDDFEFWDAVYRICRAREVEPISD